MPPTKEKKSFKKFASNHLATLIETRRKGAKAKKEKLERVERRKMKEKKEADREEKEHVEQLDRLKDTDPEFYSYLETEDPTLLQFGQEDVDLVGEDSGSDAETDVDEDEQQDDLDEADGASDGSAEPSGEGKKVLLPRVTKAELQSVLNPKKVEQAVDIFLSAVRELGYQIKENTKPQAARKSALR